MLITRRSVLSTIAASTTGIIGTAGAAEEQPPKFFGHVNKGEIILPSLHAPSEGAETIANPDPVDKRLGVAVVGLGHLSLEQIMPAFAQAKKVRCTALVSGHSPKAEVIAAQYGVSPKAIYNYDTFGNMKDNKDIDIVYIVLPNALHAEFTQRAAEAGKHVLCEKPMTTSVKDGERMIKACQDANVKLMIAYRMQYNAAHRSLVKMMREGEFGDLRMIEAVNTQHDDAPEQWRQIKALSGGGSLPDVGLYCLNAFRYITGEEPIEVTAALTQPKDDPRFREVEDLATFTMRFPSGVLAVGSSGYSAHESRRLRAMASNGWVGMDPAFSYGNLVMHIGKEAGPASSLEQRVFEPKNQFAVEMDHFAEAIQANRAPHTPGEEGLQDQKVMAAMYEAARSGQPVKLLLIEKRDAFRGPLEG